MTGIVEPGGSVAKTVGSLITSAKLRQLYASMLHCRLLTEHGPKRRRSLATGPMSLGQEALTTGWVIDLRPQDTITPALPEGMVSLIQGVPLHEIEGRFSLRRNAELAEPVAQLSAATEAAAAHKRSRKHNVAVVFAAQETCALAAWQATLKLAAKRRLPILFVVENNPWAPAAPPRALETEDSISVAARRCGVPAIPVDGNDVVAVYRVAYESLSRVRHGDGPVLVEGKTYRAAGQRSVSRSARDPLIHMERYLKQKKLFTAKWKNQLQQDFLRFLSS